MIKIPIHSINQITTNSSSEIFVKKNGEMASAVKDILMSLASLNHIDTSMGLDIREVGSYVGLEYPSEEEGEVIWVGEDDKSRYGDFVVINSSGDMEANISEMLRDIFWQS